VERFEYSSSRSGGKLRLNLQNDKIAASDLRQHAENKVREKGRSNSLSEVDVRALCHELEVHQIELEMQNEELMRLQSELIASEEKYRDLYEFAPIGYYTLESSGQIREANLTGASLLGTERVNLVNHRFQAHLARGSLLEFNAFCSRVMDSDEKQTAVFPLNGREKKGKAHFWVLIEARAIRDGIRHGFRMAVIDITERKRMEEEIDERNAELVLAKETAEAATETKAAFLANMSHELRTPMNAVIGFSSLLLDESVTIEQKEFIEGILKGGEALLAIINDILDFSRVEREIELEHQPFSLKHCINESLELVRVQARNKGLNLSSNVDCSTPDAIIGDHDRLRQILVNLLANAVKFTDTGDVSLTVSPKADDKGGKIFFKVVDTGIGIPPDKINEIFEPFTRVQGTAGRKREGAGLGLAISKNLVKLMGGMIKAESIPGQGATFSFTIQTETLQGRELDFSKIKNASVECTFHGKSLRILVAEDDPLNQKVLVEMLKRLGCRPDAVCDGTEVLRALGNQEYDLVLMDVSMPEMDGITATQTIRRLPLKNVPKIIAVTANALAGDREKCLQVGMDDYISKPVQKRDLEAIVMKYSAPLQKKA
jgi:PAS domain S-box-containing protein